ncbi:hypothetical protein HELRODRAFT_163911 [Helobdella robusta]|uniref:Arrestin-like N-terminal domain-containing protein n=1 Tax=Helobdella robusta TaxID=6412 RepID=T1EUM0_HELRO|nr:hypothetical protein HELRODRAFT_163911 [Helobdella robusta]ESN96788.1 hypothetical protein HELRODRAFT_163911 [Helobdella robusta]
MGKLESLKIILTNNKSVFCPGDMITGKCVLALKNKINLKTMFICMVGAARVEWTEATGTGEFETVQFYKSEVVYISVKQILYGNAERSVLGAGTHEFAFYFALPNGLAQATTLGYVGLEKFLYRLKTFSTSGPCFPVDPPSTPDGKLCRHGGKVKGQECSGFRKKVDPSGARAASPLGAAPDPKPGLPTRSSAASVSGDPLDLDYSGVFDKLTAVLKCVPVYDHIPKPCREKFAHDLNALLTAVCNDPGDPAHWVRLHCFVPYVLQKTSREGRRVNQGHLVNKRLETLVLCLMGPIMPNHKSTTPIGGSTLCHLVLNRETCPRLLVFPALTPTAGCVSPAEVLRAVKSFKNGSSGWPTTPTP